MRVLSPRGPLLMVALVLALLGAGVTNPAYAAVSWPTGDRVTIASGMTHPWGVAQLPDGTLLVSERDSGNIFQLKPGSRTKVGQMGAGTAQGEGGLLGLVMDPADATRGYAYVTTAADNRVVAFTWNGSAVTEGAAILTGIPRANIHNGGRLAFGPDGFLYVTTGDSTVKSLSQDRGSLAGKILRITRTGAPAPGNPFGTAIYSYGHRNVQGIDWDRQGRLWASEFGEAQWDELNLIRPGGNYGWPLVEGPSNDPRFVAPVHVWRPVDMSPSGLTVLGDHVYMGAQRGTSLWEIPILGGTPRRLLNGAYGRIRTVETIADGRLLLTTTNGNGSDVVVLVDPVSLRGEIQQKWYALGGPQGQLGAATSGEICGLRDGGCVQLFERGAIYWSPATGAHVSVGMIRDWYGRLGYENGFLGYPTTEEFCGLRDGGCGQHYQGGSIYWSPATGAHAVRGLIRAQYEALGWEAGFLGYPTSEEFCGLRDGGCGQHYQGGSIYWSPSSGAHFVRGLIRERYAAMGWEASRLAYPTGGEFCGLRDGGCGQHYQGGSIYWSPGTGAHPVVGELRRQWAASGWEAGPYGYPLAAEVCGSRSCSQRFQRGTLSIGW